MNATLRAKINNMLAMHGLGRLDDPGLPGQLGFLVRDDAHFGQLLMAAEPEHRRAMYESLRPNLRFEAKPLDVYIAEAGDDAARRQLPTVGPNGELLPYHAPDVRSTLQKLVEDGPDLRSTVQALVEEAVAKGHLTLTCKKCLKTVTFCGQRKADAIFKAREEGWTWHEGNEGYEAFEVCPSCD